MATTIPKNAQNTERIAEQTVTALNVLKSLMEQTAGKITRAEIRSVPTRFIANTITIPITIAIKKL